MMVGIVISLESTSKGLPSHKAILYVQPKDEFQYVALYMNISFVHGRHLRNADKLFQPAKPNSKKLLCSCVQ